MDRRPEAAVTELLKSGTVGRQASLALVAIGYLAAVAAAELLTTFADPRLGVAAHCLLLFGMLFHSSRASGQRQRALLLCLAFAPLIRILSLSLPLASFPQVYWYLFTSIPLFAAAVVAARALKYRWTDLGITLRGWPLQLVIGLSGIGLGTVEYLILHPKPLVGVPTWQRLWGPALILVVSTGLLEEMIFRGLLQRAAGEALARWGMPFVALIFTVLHIGYRSITDLLFVLAVGLFFGWTVQRTRSLLGVTLSHGLINIVLFLAMPFWGR